MNRAIGIIVFRTFPRRYIGQISNLFARIWNEGSLRRNLQIYANQVLTLTLMSFRIYFFRCRSILRTYGHREGCWRIEGGNRRQNVWRLQTREDVHYIFSKRREQLNQGGSRAESATSPLVLTPRPFFSVPMLLFSPSVRLPQRRGPWDSLSNLITATFNWICDRHESTFASFSFVLIGGHRLLTRGIEPPLRPLFPSPFSSFLSICPFPLTR